jgi:flagellar M-ring protein FliF
MSKNALKTVDGSTALIEGFSGLPILRQVGLLLGLAASVAIGFAVVLWSQQPDFKPLYTDISYLDASQVTTILNNEKIKYKLDTEQNTLMVDATQIHNARLKLAAAGMPMGNEIGYELLDRDNGFGASQFMEKARYHRSIEGEITKTISSISGVRSARVHIAIPTKSVFVGDPRKPSASVMVDLYPGKSLDKSQVEAIASLVAASVPEMTIKSVTVIDQKGNLLSEAEGKDHLQRATKHLEYVESLEKKYLKRINNILEPILLAENFKVEITADVDFTSQEQTSEIFTPDQAAIRSEQMTDEQRRSQNSANGVPGALSNQPPTTPVTAPAAPATGPAAVVNSEPENLRKQVSKNYELDRTISHIQHAVGEVRRLSVAVVVNNKPAPINSAAADGAADKKSKKDKEVKDKDKATASAETQRVPLTEQDIEQINRLVKDAIGFDANRGDSVVVINQAFVEKPAMVIEAVPEVTLLQQDWVKTAIEQALAALFVLIMVFAVLKPILRNLATVGKVNLAASQTFALNDPEQDEPPMKAEEPEIFLPGPEESYEAQLNAVKGMVSDDPRRVAQVVKTWLAQ